MKGQKQAPALERGLAIVDLIANARGPLGIAAIVRRSKIPKTSAVRLLAVLVRHGYLAKAGRSDYARGPRMNLAGIADRFLEHLLQAGPELLPGLSHELGNTVILLYWNGSDYQCIAKSAEPNSLAMQPVGNINNDIDAVPWGWLFMREFNDEQRARVLRRARCTATQRREIARQAAFYDAHGFTYDIKDEKRILRVAVPVLDGGRIRAALVMGRIAERADEHELERDASRLKRAAARLTGEGSTP
ncbi:MAG: helix-turn-helix domain-containing protein [Kiritimatiellae bacterium]|nr:helix-turn-helix domain-containing protein [Kiritimatiellia bacterium]